MADITVNVNVITNKLPIHTYYSRKHQNDLSDILIEELTN